MGSNPIRSTNCVKVGLAEFLATLHHLSWASMGTCREQERGDLGDRRFEAEVGVGDNQPNTAQTAAHQAVTRPSSALQIRLPWSMEMPLRLSAPARLSTALLATPGTNGLLDRSQQRPLVPEAGAPAGARAELGNRAPRRRLSKHTSKR